MVCIPAPTLISLSLNSPKSLRATKISTPVGCSPTPLSASFGPTSRPLRLQILRPPVLLRPTPQFFCQFLYPPPDPFTSGPSVPPLQGSPSPVGVVYFTPDTSLSTSPMSGSDHFVTPVRRTPPHSSPFTSTEDVLRTDSSLPLSTRH